VSPTKKPELTKEKVQVYEIVFNMFIKFVLVVVGIVAFFIILKFVLTEENPFSKGIYGVLDVMLGGTFYLVYKHYFPKK
jgi:hypothetical protein